MENPSIFLHAPGAAQVGELPMPQITDAHDVIVRIRFVGVCGSDVHFWKHGGIQTAISGPLVMGHEASGTIHAVGPAVTSVKVGDRVAIEPGHPCRRCTPCKDGKYNLCPTVKFAAAPPDNHGTLTKFWKVPEDFVYHVSDETSLQEAVLVEPLAVAVHATKLGAIKPGDTVVIIGAGTIGLMCIAVAKAFGAHKIIAVDISNEKLAYATQFGAETKLLEPGSTPEGNAEELGAAFGPVDVVIEASGAEASVQLGVYALKPGGSYVQTGIGKPKVQVPMLALSEKELRVRGCFRYGAGDFRLAVKLLERKIVDFKALISSVTPFERAPEAWERTGRGEGIKNLVQGVMDVAV